MAHYSLRYKRFDQLLDEVKLDFTRYAVENLIEPQNMIKIAKKCNYDLGLRINMPREAVLEVEHGRVRLPDDFYIFDYALLCGDFTVMSIPPQGVHVEERPFPSYKEFNPIDDICKGTGLCPTCTVPVLQGCGCVKQEYPTVVVPEYNPLVPYGDYCVKPRVFLNCKGEAWELIQIVNTEIRQFKTLMPLRLLENSQNFDCHCPNVFIRCKDEVWIEDGWLYANFQHGKIYMKYQAMMQDANGNILVVDHDNINEYYEYSLKVRLLENLWINGEDTYNQMQAMEVKARRAKTEAFNIVNTPDFKEIQGFWRANRHAMYAKYFDMFRSYQDDIWQYGYDYGYNTRSIYR